MGCVKCSYKDNLRKKQVKKSFILDFFSGCFSVALSHYKTPIIPDFRYNRVFFCFASAS